jgi:hypothetical protein
MQRKSLMIHLGIAVNRTGSLGASVRKIKALTVKMETVTLTGSKGRYNMTYFMY